MEHKTAHFFDQREEEKEREESIKFEEQIVFSENDLMLINNITDWYLIMDDLDSSYVFPGPLKVSDKPILKKYVNLLYKELTAFLKDKINRLGHNDFREAYLKLHFPGIKDLMIFRGNKIKSVNGEYWALRRVKGEVPDLKELRLSDLIMQVLLNPELKSGLVLIVGETGNGKTTTCAATIKELCRRGAFALTVEDPPELPLHGFIGKGVCIQTEVQKGDFAEAIRSAMRSYPAVNNSILYVGEVRDAETAQELIKVSANGHLVFATIHGSDIITGIKRLISNGANDNGNLSSEIRTMLASSLRLVVHQELKSLPQQMHSRGPTKYLKTQFVLSNGVSSQVGNALTHNKVDSIANPIQSQQRILESRGIEALLREEFKL